MVEQEKTLNVFGEIVTFKNNFEWRMWWHKRYHHPFSECKDVNCDFALKLYLEIV